MSPRIALFVGARLREARLLRGWSQARLSQETGIAQSMISQIERRTRNGNAFTLIRLADALEVSLDWLTGRDAYVENKWPACFGPERCRWWRDFHSLPPGIVTQAVFGEEGEGR